MPTTQQESTTLLEAVIRSLADAARHQPGAEERPVAVLWTDAKGEWRSLIPKLRERVPELLILGEYDPDARTGPAIWLRCVIDRTLADFELPSEKTPIIYLPEVSRQSLRAGDECPWHLQPLVELQYRGVVWMQKNGRDWTVEAMLVSDDGLGLDVARDAGTRRSVMASLSVLADTPISRLAGRRLEAEDFDRLMVGDHPRDLLYWMSDPDGVRREMGGGKWHAFRSRCQQDYGFDPESDGELVAGERLGQRVSGVWTALWSRFCESPAMYPGIPELLKRSKPKGTLFIEKDAWPDENASAEDALRRDLRALVNVEGSQARSIIANLEREHGERRNWVWAKLGQSPLAEALAHLAQLAERTSSNLGGESPDEMARLYAGGAYLADDAAIRALAAVRLTADIQAVQAAVRATYLPWLHAAAERFQRLTKDKPLPSAGIQPDVQVGPGTCIVFADGLRFDLAQRLAAAITERGLRVTQTRRWAALPSVTATAKPAVSPVAANLQGTGLPDSFAPEILVTKQPCNTVRFRKLLEDVGYQVINSGETGDPAVVNARGWCEVGQIDRRGHDLGVGLTGQLADEVTNVADRIVDLLDAGWRSIRVVTDHGWLLMPGGLPKHDLPRYLIESKWSRCATIKGESQPTTPRSAWHWNPTAEFAAAPGACCFSEGREYAHGGLSLQECLLADLLVETDRDSLTVTPTIESAEWFGMRLRVAISPADTSLSVDLRSKANAAESSLAVAVKQLDGEGKAGLFVEDEDLEGSAAIIVVLDPDGRVLAKQPTTISGDD